MHHKKRVPKTYIHYGASSFDVNHKLSPERYDKPAGFWASPVCTDWGWKNFCEAEDFLTETLNKSFRFQLKKGTRILKIHHPSDINPWLKETDSFFHVGIDHEKLKKEYDGMEVFVSDCWGLFHNHMPIFWSWDVDSLVIWNMDKVEVIK